MTPDEQPPKSKQELTEAPEAPTEQEKLRQLYEEQLRRQSCPGCGEGFEFF